MVTGKKGNAQVRQKAHLRVNGKGRQKISGESKIGQGRDRAEEGQGRSGDRGLAVWLCPYCSFNNPF